MKKWDTLSQRGLSSLSIIFRAPSQESQTIEANLTFLYLSSAASSFNWSNASGQRVHFVVQKSTAILVVVWRKWNMWAYFSLHCCKFIYRTITQLTNDSILAHKGIIGSGELSVTHVGERPSRKFCRRTHLIIYRCVTKGEGSVISMGEKSMMYSTEKFNNNTSTYHSRWWYQKVCIYYAIDFDLKCAVRTVHILWGRRGQPPVCPPLCTCFLKMKNSYS